MGQNSLLEQPTARSATIYLVFIAALFAVAQSARAIRKIASEAHEGDVNKGQRGPCVAILNGSGHATASVGRVADIAAALNRERC